jgi:hypothetical protein
LTDEHVEASIFALLLAIFDPQDIVVSHMGYSMWTQNKFSPLNLASVRSTICFFFLFHGQEMNYIPDSHNCIQLNFLSLLDFLLQLDLALDAMYEL